MVALDPEMLGHVGDHIGLADGLAAGDRQRLVRIGIVQKRPVDEMLARHLVHGAQHRCVADPALAQAEQELHAADIVVARRLFGHGASLTALIAVSDEARPGLNAGSARIDRDILTEYAVVGLAALPLLYGPRRLLATISALSLALWLASPWLPPPISFPDTAWIAHHVEQARQVYGGVSFMEILAFRIDEVRTIAPLHVYAMPRTFGLFLLGAWMWRTGFFRPTASRGFLATAACVMLVFGAWMTGAAARGDALGWQGRALFQSLTQLILAAGYGAATVVLAEHPVGQKLVGWAGPLGRMAFTNYIAQSIILSCIFYGFGLALFGRLSVTQSIAVAIVIYAAQAAFSAWWLRRFRFGPIEWLWRSLMYGERQCLSATRLPA